MSLQAMIAKTLLKLPAGLLVRMSGGGPVTVRGWTLDPQLQFLAHGAKGQPAMSSLTAEQGRAASAAGLALFAARPEPGVATRDFALERAKAPDIPVRLYTPHDQDPAAPMMVFFHFGGGVIGDLDTCHAFCSMIASIARCPILSVDYRLAPEHRWPAGLEDCLFAYEWALKNAGEHGAPSGEAAIGGDSMGGNFSAIIAQEARRRDIPQPALQLLIYPAVDISRETPSHTDFADAYPLSRDTMHWFMEHYLPEGADRADLLISPNQETNLEGLAPAIVVTAGFDPLVDEGDVYARRLEDAGVDVRHKRYDSLIHGFTAFTGVSKACDAACREIAGMVCEAYAGRATA